MAALQYVDTPGYAALLLRRTYADLSLPGALMDRANTWLRGTEAKWHDAEKTWQFPSGGTLTFGYLEHENQKYRYQGAEFHFVGFDELTQFTETSYRYLFSRLRRLEGVTIPLRIRSASNPGGQGHDWVKQRFITEGAAHGRVVVPAKLVDNPHIDEAEYRTSLAQLDPTTRAQLLQGNWDVRPPGAYFQRSWFLPATDAPVNARRVRYWDKAGTEGGSGARTAGVLMAGHDKVYWVEDVVLGRWSAGQREKIILQTAQDDKRRYNNVTTWVEQEPGSGGKESAEATIRLLAGHAVRADRVTGDKTSRAAPLASQAEAGNVKVVPGTWNTEYLDEMEGFPLGLKDQVDASSGAFNKLTAAGGEWYTF